MGILELCHGAHREVPGVADNKRIEIELDDEHHSELVKEAERLGLPVEEVAHRAIAAWLSEMEEDNTYPEGL